MKKRTKEENAAYSKMLRVKRRVAPTVAPTKERSTVAPISVAPGSKCSTQSVAPERTLVAPCKGCEDLGIASMILRGRISLLEKELGEVRKLIPKKADSPYRGF